MQSDMLSVPWKVNLYPLPTPQRLGRNGRSKNPSACRRIRWNRPASKPDIDQWLHGLQVLLGQQLVQHGNRHEMHETTVQLFVHPQVIERVLPVSVVEVRVASKHLPRDVLAIGQKALRKAAGLADPFVARESGEWGVQCRRTCRDRGSRARRVHSTGSVSGRRDGG